MEGISSEVGQKVRNLVLGRAHFIGRIDFFRSMTLFNFHMPLYFHVHDTLGCSCNIHYDKTITIWSDLTHFIRMDYPIHTDTATMKKSILYFKWLPVKFL